MMEATTTKQLRIAGRVQGVGYRAAFAREAQRLVLSGWVRNRRDGTVEALICGSANAVDAIIAWSRQGPSLARVEHVSVHDAPEPASIPALGTFDVLPTE